MFIIFVVDSKAKTTLLNKTKKARENRLVSWSKYLSERLYILQIQLHVKLASFPRTSPSSLLMMQQNNPLKNYTMLHRLPVSISQNNLTTNCKFTHDLHQLFSSWQCKGFLRRSLVYYEYVLSSY